MKDIYKYLGTMSRRQYHSRQLRRLSSRQGSLHTNRILRGMCRSNKTSLQNNLSNIPDLLIQPIFPGFSSSRRMSQRRRSYACTRERSSIKKRQSTVSMERCDCHKTNISFTGWQRRSPADGRTDTNKLRARPSSFRNSSKLHASVHHQSKLRQLWEFVQITLEENPRVRPSLCSFVTGLFVIILGFIFVSISFFQITIPKWFSVALVAFGAIGMLAGSVGTAIYLFKMTDDRKKRYHVDCFLKKRTNSKSKIPEKRIKKLQKSVEEEPKSEQNKGKIEDKTCNGHSPKKYTKSDLEKALAVFSDVSTKRRKLPDIPSVERKSSLSFSSTSPVHVASQSDNPSRENTSTTVTKRKNDDANCRIRNRSSPNKSVSRKLSYYSSEPDLLFHGKPQIRWKTKNENVFTFEKDLLKSNSDQNDKVEVLHPQADLNKITKQRLFKTTTNTNDNNNDFYLVESSKQAITPERYSTKHLEAKKIFDVYHDPLLNRAITRLKFHCDCEFRDGEKTLKGQQKAKFYV